MLLVQQCADKASHVAMRERYRDSPGALLAVPESTPTYSHSHALPVSKSPLSPRQQHAQRQKAQSAGLIRLFFLAGALLCMLFAALGLKASTVFEGDRQAELRRQHKQSKGFNRQQDSVGPYQATRLTDRQLFEAVQKQHPINRLQCGAWVSEYAQLHKDILEGKAPQRYAVMRSRTEFMNGLADRLATSVTIFLYAVLTNRAFQYDWDPPPLTGEEYDLVRARCGSMKSAEPQSHLWNGFKSDYIDWRYTGKDKGQKTVVMDYNCDLNVEEYKYLFSATDISQLHDDAHTVVWQADHAMVWSMFDNPHIQHKLLALGLTRENAFACLFDFLYRPTYAVLDLFRPELDVLLDPNVLKIGVQIRVGDWQLCDRYLFKPQQFPVLFDHYFECARQIEQELIVSPGQRVVYYTLSDIPALRAGLASRYASRILVNTAITVEHIVKTQHNSEHGFLEAVGELWLFSLTHAQVITRKSGFGKVPAMVSAQGTQHIFTMDYPMVLWGVAGLDNRKKLGRVHLPVCTKENAAPLEQLCTDFTGI